MPLPANDSSPSLLGIFTHLHVRVSCPIQQFRFSWAVRRSTINFSWPNLRIITSLLPLSIRRVEIPNLRIQRSPQTSTTLVFRSKSDHCKGGSEEAIGGAIE